MTTKRPRWPAYALLILGGGLALTFGIGRLRAGPVPPKQELESVENDSPFEAAPGGERRRAPSRKPSVQKASVALDRRMTDSEFDSLLDVMSSDPSDATLGEIVLSLRGKSGSANFLVEKARALRGQLLAGEAVGLDLWRSLFLLGELGDKSAIPALRQMALEPDLTDPSEAVFRADQKAKIQAVQSLSRLEAVDELRGMLTDSPSSRVEGPVLVALHELGQPEPGYPEPPAYEPVQPPRIPASKRSPEDAPTAIPPGDLSDPTEP